MRLSGKEPNPECLRHWENPAYRGARFARAIMPRPRFRRSATSRKQDCLTPKDYPASNREPSDNRISRFPSLVWPHKAAPEEYKNWPHEDFPEPTSCRWRSPGPRILWLLAPDQV